MDCFSSKDVVLQLHRCVQTNFNKVFYLYAHTVAVIRLNLSKKNKPLLKYCTFIYF